MIYTTVTTLDLDDDAGYKEYSLYHSISFEIRVMHVTDFERREIFCTSFSSRHLRL
jgi:hypothetical protein